MFCQNKTKNIINPLQFKNSWKTHGGFPIFAQPNKAGDFLSYNLNINKFFIPVNSQLNMAVVVQWLERATVARKKRVRFPPSAYLKRTLVEGAIALTRESWSFRGQNVCENPPSAYSKVKR